MPVHLPFDFPSSFVFPFAPTNPSTRIISSRLARRGDKPGKPCPVGGDTTQGIAKGAMRRITPEDARERFRQALERLREFDGSPFKRLRDDFYPDWKAAFLNQGGRYLSACEHQEVERKAR